MKSRRKRLMSIGGAGPVTPPPPVGTVEFSYRSNSDDFLVSVPNVDEPFILKNVFRAGYNANGSTPSPIIGQTFTVNHTATVNGTHTAEINSKRDAAIAWTLANPGQWALVLFPQAASSYIYEGTSDISVTGGITRNYNVVFRGGSGASRVTIQFVGSAGSGAYNGHFSFRGATAGISLARTSIVRNEVAGATVLRLASSSNITNGKFGVGKYVLLEQERFPTKYDQYFSRWTPPGTPAPTKFVRKLVRIVAVNAATSEVTIDIPLYYDLTAGSGTRLEERPNVGRNVGFEDIRFAVSGSTVHDIILFQNFENGWIKNVEFDTPFSFAFHVHNGRHVTIDNCTGKTPTNVGGDFNGYAGFVGCSECLLKDSDFTAFRHGPLLQGNAAGCVITNCDFYDSDWHYHTGASMGCLVDNCRSFKDFDATPTSTAKPFHFDMPTAENTIHDPEGFFVVAWNIDGGQAPAWGRSFRLGAFLEECTFAYMRFGTQCYHLRRGSGAPPDRIPMLTTYGSVGGPVRFIDTSWFVDREALKAFRNWTDLQVENFVSKAWFLDIGPGVIREINGVYGQQTGLYSYPAYQGDPGSDNYLPEVPSDYDLRFWNTKVYGIPQSRLITGFGSRVPVKNSNMQQFDNKPDTVPFPTPPVTSLYTAAKAYWDAIQTGSSPAYTVAPVVSGTTTIGSTLTTTNGTWAGTDPITYTYQWTRNGVAISGATSSTYVIATADAGTNVRCEVTGTNVIGASIGLSNITSIPSLWTENQISSKIFSSWFFEQPGVADGQPITFVADTKGARPIISSSGFAPSHETNELNGRGVANFANNSRLFNTNSGVAQPVPYELYSVIKLDALVNGQRVIRVGLNDNGILYGGGTGSAGAIRVFAGNDGPVITLSQNQWAISRFSVNGASSESQLNAGTPVSGNAGNSVGSSDAITFGARNQSETNGADMQLAYFSIVQTPLTTNERDKYHGWMAHTWGLTSLLPSNHPFKVNPPQV